MSWKDEMEKAMLELAVGHAQFDVAVKVSYKPAIPGNIPPVLLCIVAPHAISLVFPPNFLLSVLDF